MSRDTLSFFTIDHGSASTAAALIGRLGGRFRLLGAAAVQAGLPVEPLLEGLVNRVAETDPEVLPDRPGWPEWARVEAASQAPGRLVCVAPTERRLAVLETAVLNSGWEVAGRITPERTDALAATEFCLVHDLTGIAVGAGDPPDAHEREPLRDILALVAGVARRRPELICVLAGGAGEHAAAFAAEQVVLAPAPERGAANASTPLREAMEELAQRRNRPGQDGDPMPDSRRGFRSSIFSLAALLERRIEGVDVGQTGGVRAFATSDGEHLSLIRADGGLTPSQVLQDDRFVDTILRWSPLRGETLALRDRVRNLRLAPWRGATGDGARLRLAAARGALSRLDAAWTAGGGPSEASLAPAADLLIASGGVFALAPPPAVALCLLDTLRRPGGLALLHDHARLLGPLGTLEDESDRRRLLADLLDDAFVPLGSAIVAAGLKPGRQAGSLRLSADGSTTEVELTPGAVQLIDLPPGRAATVEIETREDAWLGVRARQVALEVAGGLGGLLLDTRDIPLRLPERPDRRRDLLDAWQRPLWIGGD